ncbi:hypothetical protein BDW68DRAFT_156757 [Aspergillus falconensis]
MIPPWASRLLSTVCMCSQMRRSCRISRWKTCTGFSVMGALRLGLWGMIFLILIRCRGPRTLRCG